MTLDLTDSHDVMTLSLTDGHLDREEDEYYVSYRISFTGMSVEDKDPFLQRRNQGIGGTGLFCIITRIW